MKKYLLLTLGLLAIDTLLAQDEPPHEATAAIRQRLAAANTDTTRVNLKLALADAYIEEDSANAQKMDTAMRLLSEIEKTPAIHTSRRLEGLLHYVYARAFRSGDNRDSAIQQATLAADLLPHGSIEWAKACIEIGYNNSHVDPSLDSVRSIWFQKAIPVFASLHTTDSKEWYGHTLMCLAQSHRFKPAESVAMYLKAIDIWKSAGHHDYRNVYNHLGAAFSAMGDQQQALQYGMLAVREDESRSWPDSHSPNVYNGLAYIYYQGGDVKNALIFFRKAFNMAMQVGDPDNISSYASNVIACSISVGNYSDAMLVLRQVTAAHPPKNLHDQINSAENFASIFYKMNQLDSIQPHIQRLIQLDKAVPLNNPLRFHTLLVPTRYFNASGQYALAKKYAEEIVRLSVTLGVIEAGNIGYRELAHSDSAMGNYKAALDEYQKYIQGKDSIHDANNTKQIEALKIQYETEKKDKDIQSLNHQQQLSQLALHQASLTRNFIIAGAVLLLILLILSINRYRLKQRSNKQLSLLLKEKEWLVKEIHHRVKNNLHMISGLLDSQAGFVKTGEAASAIRESQHRVNAMSMVHQKLYQTANLSMTDMSAYISEFIAYLEASFNCYPRIRFHLQVERVQFDLNHTIPICLILNEAITNAIKYAFPDGRKGEITIILHRQENDQFLLSIADDGVGIPDSLTKENAGSMGMNLMRGLSEDIGGDLSIDGSHGTKIEIVFSSLQDHDISWTSSGAHQAIY